MGNILCCCVCPKSDDDEVSGCPPESKICEATAEDMTAAAPTAAAIEPAELTVEAGEDLPVHDICDGEMPGDRALESHYSDHPKTKKSQAVDRALESDPSDHLEGKKYPADDRALESDPSDHPEGKKYPADDRALESDPSDHPEGKKYPADDRALESDPSDHPEGKKYPADGEATLFFSTKKKSENSRLMRCIIEDRALESDPSDHPEGKKYPADDRALESDPSDHPEGKKYPSNDRALECDPSDHPEGRKYSADDSSSELSSSQTWTSQTDSSLELSSSETWTSQTAQEIGENSLRNHIYMDHFSLKFSSCSTIFLEDSTASCPDFEMTLHYVALEFYFLTKERKGIVSFTIFDERVYPLEDKMEKYIRCDPSQTMIYEFIRSLFYVKILNVADVIKSRMYIQRLLRCAPMYIRPTTWRRIILGAFLVVIKVGSNVAVCNEDLCMRFEKTTVDDLNMLEMYFLRLIDYDTNVSKSTYTGYYFRLRDFIVSHGLSSPTYLLDRKRAWDLQALSRMEQYEVFYTGKTRSVSVDDVTTLQRTRAILS
ncbi:cyclin-Y-like protein 2 isoform X5 [Callithrix jacchus]